MFRFCECHPKCGCNKETCLNYLMLAENKKNFAVQIRRITKQQFTMWALFAEEEIIQGSFICEYRGEIVTKK